MTTPKKNLEDLSKGELLELLESQFALSRASEMDKQRAQWALEQACRLADAKAATHVANLLVGVRARMAEAGGLSDQLLLCKVARELRLVRDMVHMAGMALADHELVWGVSSIEPSTDLRREVAVLDWAMAVLMGRTTEDAPKVLSGLSR